LGLWQSVVTPASLAEDYLSQKWWSQKLHVSRARTLERSMLLRDKQRYTLQRMPGTTSWMVITPNQGLSQKLESRNYRILLKWWLGISLSSYADQGRCPCCEEQMDSFGDHLVSCKYNQPQARHNALRNALAEALKEFNISTQLEVPIGGARRPADIGLMSFDSRGPLAVDLVVHHPLAPGAHRSVSTTVFASLKAAEEAKIRESAELCSGNNWLFSPMGWHPWGGVGPHGAALRTRLEKEVCGDLKGWPRRNRVQEFRSKLTFALMSFVSQQLLAGEEALLDLPSEPISAPLFRGGPVFTAQELEDGAQLEAEDLPAGFCGPIRIRTWHPCPNPSSI
jgi:hypothetical protein